MNEPLPGLVPKSESLNWLSELREAGPAVILGNAESIFTRQLAATWKKLGLDVRIVTGHTAEPPDNVSTIDARPYRSGLVRGAMATNKILRPIERLLPRLYAGRYRRRTGRPAAESWEWRWVDHFWESFERARAVDVQHPAFVLAQEASSYGYAMSRCRSRPRILFPWGGDIFLCCETSPVMSAIVGKAIRSADLIVPSSSFAAEHICRRFGVSEAKVRAISWGVDLGMFCVKSADERASLKASLGLPARSPVLLNARRFNPLWGSTLALDAALYALARHPDLIAVFLGGGSNPEDLREAHAKIAAAGMTDRVTLLGRTIPLEECAKWMMVSDIFFSLMRQGDMRSSSVLQAAAAGGFPIIADSPEHRHLVRQGFVAHLVSTDDPQAIGQAVLEILAEPIRIQSARASNQSYLAAHENQMVQMLTLLQAIHECRRQVHSARREPDRPLSRISDGESRRGS